MNREQVLGSIKCHGVPSPGLALFLSTKLLLPLLQYPVVAARIGAGGRQEGLWSWDMFSQGKSIKNFEYCLSYVKHNLRSILGSHLMHMTFHNVMKNDTSSSPCAHLVVGYYLVNEPLLLLDYFNL